MFHHSLARGGKTTITFFHETHEDSQGRKKPKVVNKAKNKPKKAHQLQCTAKSPNAFKQFVRGSLRPQSRSSVKVRFSEGTAASMGSIGSRVKQGSQPP